METVVYYITKIGDNKWQVTREGMPDDWSPFLGVFSHKEFAEEVIHAYIDWQGGMMYEN